ncbi:hypothetical protein [Paenibacillus thalictri]|uniref:Endolytic transglycosylase MltG n=1 Tax=Paenibacillus thalictri TaxID=2527873 RepID=A0A4Q9DRH8_9BACL|nr:hypothetical protein [Paenibacillus thalictri]TBL77757.1 hypothetical protein EYB31_16575 [Paenibacillus thalictri]
MFKNKTLLYGLGIGLIIGSLLVQLMNQARGSAPAPIQTSTPPQASAKPADKPDAKQVKELASQYYQVFPKEEKLYTQAQADALVQQKVEEAKKQAGAAAAPSAKKTYIFVPAGANSTQVADMLYQSSLLADRKAFEDAMKKDQLSSRIIAGLHVFEGQPNLDEVIVNLTTH